jgi:hypothetical protein
MTLEASNGSGQREVSQRAKLLSVHWSILNRWCGDKRYDERLLQLGSKSQSFVNWVDVKDAITHIWAG